MKRINYAYIAGLVDGEGCFVVSHRNRSSGWYFRLEVTNTNIALINYLKTNLGGGVRVLRSVVFGENWKPIYRWGLEGKKAKPVVEAIEPYLVGKKEQAKTVLQFWDDIQSAKPRMTVLNRRGLPLGLVNREVN